MTTWIDRALAELRQNPQQLRKPLINTALTKQCSKCHEELLRSEFGKNKQNKDGLHSQCRKCANTAGKKWKEENSEKNKEMHRKYYRKNREKIRQKAKESYANGVGQQWYQNNKERILSARKGLEGTILGMFRAARSRAKKDNIPFDLTIEYLHAIATENCPVTNKPMDWDKEESSSLNRPSLDKIIPELGYVQGNVAIISYRMNTKKNNLLEAELIQLLQYIQLHSRKK
jgi:bacterioferritin-associated ferredoxin